MKKLKNRRQWLKTMAAASAGIAIAGSAKAESTTLKSTQFKPTFLEWENTNLRKKLPELKARLLANENPYGPSLMTKEAIQTSITKGNRYGHGQAADLIEMLAEKEGVPKEYIMLGPGSSDLLEKVAITLFMEGGNLVGGNPTYMSLIKTAKAFNAEWKAVPVLDDWQYDLDKMGAAIDDETKLVYICNPNNPTGTVTDGKALWSFCKEYADQVPIFVDEAYLEFMYPEDKMSMVGLINEDKNIIVSRTFSKVYGMAGIRVGYIVALPSTLEMVSKIFRGNMGLNVTALEGAMVSLGDEQFVKETVEKNTACRTYVVEELEKLGYKPLASQTSFILFPIEMNGKEYLEKMLGHKIGVRSFEIFDQTYCRVSMGTMDEMKMFLEAFKQVIA